jgi:hypothetical protein
MFRSCVLGLVLLSVASVFRSVSASCPTLSPPSTVPKNSYLADSPWPIAHTNSYAQDSTLLSAPTAQDVSTLKVMQLPTNSVAINPVQSSAYSDCSRALWYADAQGVGKMALGGGMFTKVAYLSINSTTDTLLSGAYAFLDPQGTFFVPFGNTIVAVRDQQPSQLSARDSAIIKVGEFSPPLNAGDIIVGMNITYNGYLAYATQQGQVGIVSREFANGTTAKTQVQIQLPGTQQVRNSIAVDEQGGIYIVSNTFMNRVQWTGTTLSVQGADGAWRASYTGNTNGSGSTPTLMGTPTDLDQLVVITDGQLPMNLVAFWRNRIPTDAVPLAGKDKRIAAEVPVSFGDRNAQSQQSVVVGGYGAVVVNNNPQKGSATATRPPYGIQKFQWDPTRNTLSSAWVNTQLSFPNGIPALSLSSNLVYAVGYRVQQNSWTAEAVDWTTGQSVFSKPLGVGPSANSLYAGMSITDGRSLITGSASGIYYLQP